MSGSGAVGGSLVAPVAAARRRWWAWLRLVGGALIIAVLVWRLGTAAFLDGLRVVDAGTVLVAVAIGVVTTVGSAWRWCLVARGLGVRLPLGAAVGDYYRALFLNAALPGGVLGDVHRAVRHGREVGDIGRGLRAVVLERATGQVALVAVAVPVLLAGPWPLPLPAPVGWLLAAAVVAVGLAVAARLRRRRSGPGGGWPAVGRVWRTVVADVRLGVLARDRWPGIVVSSLVVLAGHLATFLVAARAAGAAVPVARLLPLALLALLAMAVPLNVGGWGPREGVTAWAFGAAGLGATLGLTVAVVYGLLAFAASLPGAAALAAGWAPRRRAAQAPPKRSESA